MAPSLLCSAVAADANAPAACWVAVAALVLASPAEFEDAVAEVAAALSLADAFALAVFAEFNAEVTYVEVSADSCLEMSAALAASSDANLETSDSLAESSEAVACCVA